jgi:hypothetical protein
MILGMGMFDTIYLDKAIACKTCGGDVLDFQTKEFDSCMNHYRVGSVLLGSRVLSGVIKDEAYCRACSDAKRHAWTDVYLVVWHTILAGVETEESKAQARLASVDRLDLVQWIAEAQKNEQQWRRRFYSLHNELRRWHEYVEEQKKPQEPESESNKRLRVLRSIWSPSEEIKTAADPIGKILELHAPQEERRRAWVFLISGFLEKRAATWQPSERDPHPPTLPCWSA